MSMAEMVQIAAYVVVGFVVLGLIGFLLLATSVVVGLGEESD